MNYYVQNFLNNVNYVTVIMLITICERDNFGKFIIADGNKKAI